MLIPVDVLYDTLCITTGLSVGKWLSGRVVVTFTTDQLDALLRDVKFGRR